HPIRRPPVFRLHRATGSRRNCTPEFRHDAVARRNHAPGTARSPGQEHDRQETRPAGAEHEGPGADRTAGCRAVTVTGYAPGGLAPTRRDGRGTGIPARRPACDDLADRAARLPWCWPALVTLVVGFYQVGRPELWRGEAARLGIRPPPGARS